MIFTFQEQLTRASLHEKSPSGNKRQVIAPTESRARSRLPKAKDGRHWALLDAKHPPRPKVELQADVTPANHILMAMPLKSIPIKDHNGQKVGEGVLNLDTYLLDIALDMDSRAGQAFHRQILLDENLSVSIAFDLVEYLPMKGKL